MQMEKKSQILHLLSTLYSQQSVNRLVEVCFKIAASQLRFNYRKVQKIILRDEVSIEDIAIDSIASLFEKDESGRFNIIMSAFNSWQPPIKTEDDALYFLNKLIQRRVEQHISLMLREADPFFSKLMDSVNYLVNKHKFKKISYLGTVYIINSGSEEVSGKAIPLDEFEKLPAMLFRERKNLLQNIFHYLVSETSYASAIPFNAIIYKLKDLNVGLYRISEATSEQNEEIEIGSIINEALIKSYEKLEDSYVRKEKLSHKEGEIFKKTLADLAKDIRDGGIESGLCKYLSVHIQGLDEQTYKQKYHNILEYLLKMLKQNIADELEQ
jgi:hypothetical protein